MRISTQCLLVIGLVISVSSTGAAQGNIHWVNSGLGGTGPYHLARVAAAGDVNGDGVPDVVVGYGDNGVPTDVVEVLSGVDGSLIYTYQGPPNSGFGLAIAGAGDVDGDGFADFIIGAQGLQLTGPNSAGYAEVYSGATGGVLRTFNGSPGDYFGFSVAGAGDVNGDGLDDVVVGAPSWSSGPYGGYAKVFSPQTNAMLLYIPGVQVGGLFGYSVASVGDVNGDGKPDLIVGDPVCGATSGTGDAMVHSGADGSLLFTLTGAGLCDGIGTAVSGLGDVDGDNVPDVIASSAWASGSPYSYVASGASTGSGTILHTLNAGRIASGLGDVDGDGVPDVVASKAATVFSLGTPAATLGSYGAPDAYASVAGIGDVNGDGIPDMAVGERWGTRVWVIIMGLGYQQNSPLATLHVGGNGGSANIPAGLVLALNSSSFLMLMSTSTNMPWELGFGIAPLVPQGAGAFTTVGGQILNLDLTDPTLGVLWNYFQSPGFANTYLPFSVPSPGALSFQMLVVAPPMPSGVAISQPTRLIVQ